jgi:sialate O-acetylesterase
MNPRRPPLLGPTLFALAVWSTLSCSADFMLAPPFTDHAVLQRERPIPLWGHGTAGETITVSFHGQKRQAVVDSAGKWAVQLAAMPADAAGRELTVAGLKTIILHDVVVGEVWLASGQSNMEWPLSRSTGGKEEATKPANRLIRQLKIDRSPSDLPVDSVKTGGWKVAAPDTVGEFSGVAYFFARALAEKLQVPVGLINSSWGGTAIESWLPEAVLRTTKAWPHFNEEWTAALKVFPQKLAEYPALDAAWRKADEEHYATGKPNLLPWPHPPVGPGTAYAPGGLFNGMIAPLAPYALRGALWYQGESNVGRASEYAELFPAMIGSWRKIWGGDFQFLFVQLPNYADGDPTGRKWAQLREAQNTALKLPGVGVAITLDVGDAANLHPPNKQPVGERLARAAESLAYRLPVESSGPVFKSATRDGAIMRVKFSHASSPWLRRGRKTLDSKWPVPTGFFTRPPRGSKAKPCSFPGRR